ncbi:NAD-dependent epimerase/dehydratase family protein [Chloroflexia bacterium SDU3-3]|nr:NAD-dependent epimerase/dehydratase family protein [Chloroflexia bacterium SDU3-3]
MRETVLVTGGSGYVAEWCVVELLRQGYTVRTTVRSLAKEPQVRAQIGAAIDPGEQLRFFAADLLDDAGWDAAVAGCDYVLHVASPLDAAGGPDALIAPARDGALRVLRASARAGVRRVVMTSACAAASPTLYTDDSISDESVWTDPNDTRISAYRKSKTLAELAAWKYIEEEARGQTELSTILPGAVFGPVLSAAHIGTAQVIQRIMRGSALGVPRIGFEVVDVRDLADIHIRAMTHPHAAGQRFIAVSEFMWMSEIAGELRARLGDAARGISTHTLPDILIQLVARFDRDLLSITPALGRKNRHTAAKARQLLGWQPRSARETVIDCAQSLIGWGQG